MGIWIYITHIYICALSQFSHVQLFATPWTITYQVPLFMGFSQQEYWSELPCPPPVDLPNPGIELTSLSSPVLAGRFFITDPPKKPRALVRSLYQISPEH